MTPETHAITSEEYFDHPPARVWHALTDPAKLRRWFMDCDLQPVLGHRFTLAMGPFGTTRCEVLALEPERLLRISWVNPPLDTTVTWRLAAEGRGTRLYFEHAGFDLADPRQRRAYDGMASGWRSKILTRLGEALATISRPSGPAPAAA